MPRLICTVVALFALVAISALGTANASTIVLDSTNGYSFAIEPGATLSHVTPLSLGTFTGIDGTNLEFAIGTSDVAVFPGLTHIGGHGNPKLGGNRPRDLVNGAVDFTILVTASGNKYDAVLTYFAPPNGSFGTPPSPNNTAVSVFEITAAVPEPTTAMMVLAACATGLATRRRR